MQILCILLRPTGARFSDKKRQQWDINKEPKGGVLVGVPLWGADVDFEYRVGSKDFLEQDILASIVQKHEPQLQGLQKVLEHAPEGRDAGTAVERVLHLCIVARLVHIARIFPPSFSVPAFKKCHQMTIQFVVQKLYVWKKHYVIQEKLVMWNLELQIAEGEAGLIPHWKLADASYVASWLQPLQT